MVIIKDRPLCNRKFDSEISDQPGSNYRIFKHVVGDDSGETCACQNTLHLHVFDCNPDKSSWVK